ncbi:MAG: helix-turn-helix domain-containing protein [Candidatus Dadabacteria bacterium]
MALNRHSGPEGGLLQKGGGYFQVPDLVFDLDLTANEKLVLIYFMRRADRQGRSFPSVDRICRDCGFGSRNTARKAMNTLINAGLIRRVPVPGRSYNFYISKELRRVIKDAKSRYGKNEIASPAAHNDGTGGDASLRGSVRDRGNLTDISTDAEASLNHLTDLSHMMTEASATRSEYDPARSNADPPGGQNMTPKEYTVEGNSNKEDAESLKEDAREKTKRVLEEACASSSSDPRLDDDEVTMLDVANHMDALTLAERRRFDTEALKLRNPGEPDPRENLWQKRVLRVRHLRRLRGRGG